MHMDPSIKRYTKQYPIGPALNIDINTTKDSVQLKWTDPKNPILDKIYFSKWEFTKIIKKKNTPPENIWDGETILDCKEYNKYSEEYFVDNDVELGSTYYYAIVPCSDLGKHSWDKVDMIKLTIVDAKPVLSDNTIDTINTMIHNGCASKLWNIGDTISLDISAPISSKLEFKLSRIDINDKDRWTCESNEFFRERLLFVSKDNIGFNESEDTIKGITPKELKDTRVELSTQNNNKFVKDFLTAPIFTDNPSRISKVNNLSTGYNVGEHYVDETGKVTESLGVKISNNSIPIFEIRG